MRQSKTEITALVKVVGDEPRASTLDIAKGLKVTHNAVIKLTDKFKDDLETFGTLRFEILKSGGLPTRFALLNEGQTMRLMVQVRGSDVANAFRHELIHEFMRMKKVISRLATQRTNELWKEQRAKGIADRREETDMIAVFVKYCEANGSKNAAKYYPLISTMENKALFIVLNEFKGTKNIRDILDFKQLTHISEADHIAGRALEQGMALKMDYHDIFKMAKERVNQFAALIGVSTVPSERKIEEGRKLTLLPS